jgi:hypothetical protein
LNKSHGGALMLRSVAARRSPPQRALHHLRVAICRQEVPIGSHIPTLRCFTLRQLSLEAELARRQMTTDESNKSPSR